MNETTVMMEFVRSASGSDDRARLSRRYGIPGRAQMVDAADLEAVPLEAVVAAPGYDLRWLLRMVPALLVAMAPSH